MNTVKFIDRGAFKRGVMNDSFTENDALISISCTEDEMKEINSYLLFYRPNSKSFLCHFFDNDQGVDEETAKKLVKFIEQNAQKNFVVHCFMGVSRSGAVAKFINEYYGLNDPVLENYKNYNQQVFNQLNAVIGRDLASYYAELEAQDRPTFSGR
jgi:protein-tyrosine phosphatase